MNLRSGLGGMLLSCSAFLIPSTEAFASRANPPLGKTGSPASLSQTCNVCHVTSGATGSVQILGAPSSYQVGVNYDLTIRISDPDITQVGAGFEISVENPSGVHMGQLIITDPVNTKFNDLDSNQDWVNHNTTGVANSILNWNGSADYNVRWKAPLSDMGPITFWAVGNAINDNSVPSGDHIYAASVTAAFDPTPPIPAVSEWGLAALGLCVLTSATILVGRRFVA